MEEILRKKFIKISVGISFTVLLTIGILLNFLNYYQIYSEVSQITAILVENNGTFPNIFDNINHPRKLPQETQFSTRFFVIRLDKQNKVLSVDTKNVHIVDTMQAISYAQGVINFSDASGFSGNYRYEIRDTDYGKILVFVDCEGELLRITTFLWASIAVFATALVAIYILSIILSKKAVKPIVKSYNKQQQFITDISHELKTPLAIIKTNTEVIECVTEESEWTESIHHQINRLSDLVNYLISLSKMDEDEGLIKSEFSLSDAILETIEDFNILAESVNKKIICNISKNYSFVGDEQSIRVLFSILIENSVKYSIDNSEIEISIEEHKGKNILIFKNYADNLKIENYEQLFERFYRLDNSRNSSTGGFGIGLAMAKTIVKKHNGEISAQSLDAKSLILKVVL